MSSFQVSNQSISRIAEFIVSEIGTGCAKCTAMDLYQMNLDAIRSRYGKSEHECEFEFIPGSLDDGSNDSDLAYQSEAQLHQNIRCYLYQCMEGDVPESKFFLFVEKLGRDLREKTIKNFNIHESEFEHACNNSKWE